MPKVLSLKKTNNSKNQKSITQFFNNFNNGTNGQKSESVEKPIDPKKSSKRKVLSPVQTDFKTGSTKPSNGGGPCDIRENIPKKCKTDPNISISPLKNDDKQTVSNVNFKHHESGSNLTDLEKCENVLEYKEHKSERSPLVAVDIDNVREIDNCINHPNKSNSKSSQREIENHVPNITNQKSPELILDSDYCHSPKRKGHVTSLKSPKGTQYPTGRLKVTTPKKGAEQSPSKHGSTVKVLEFTCADVDDIFGDDWEIEQIEEDFKEDLDFSKIQRCEILSIEKNSAQLKLKLKNQHFNRGTCFLEGVWLDTPLRVGDIVGIQASRGTDGQFCVSNSSGLLSLHPDHLISTTSVVAGVFCKRKAVLQERWRGIDAANTAMTIGILVHELVQKALTQSIVDVRQLQAEVDHIIKTSTQMLYDAGLSEEEARSNMQLYITPLAEFMHTYVVPSPMVVAGGKNKWNGQIDKVLDIEENICCPQLGLKGKIDATLQVTIHDRGGRQRAIVPLELKSGRASVSAEHRGQLVLYGMMLSLQRDEDPATAIQRGLLLYLKERMDLREVSCGYPERRDLVMLRNQLAQHLAPGSQQFDPDTLVDIEEASNILQQSLPEPVHHHSACAKCPYLTICSLHLWHTKGPTVSESHPLVGLHQEALGHLSMDHIQYFLHWTSLLRLEEKGQLHNSPLHALWTETTESRSKRGACAANLKLKCVTPSGDRYLHNFARQHNSISKNEQKSAKGPMEGEFSIVSVENRPWIAAGVVTVAKDAGIHILLERDLSRRLHKDTLYHIDTYESYATTVQNLTNLGILMEDSDRALRLRRLIIERDSGKFAAKLPREVGRLGARLMRSLNIEQQRAVLRALAAEDYALLQGLPGTGKTQTISVLIQMLVALKQRVLVTAHTHSAVDTVLSRLPDSVRVMRLGSTSRVAASLLPRCEHKLSADCHTPDMLDQLYHSMEVVGVTCLGANHAMLAKTMFDVCIVDEATQVLQCTVLRPLFAAKRFVLVGDPDQLPPVVRSNAARRLGMEESLFHRLMCDEATSTLRLQYRMNQALVDISNRVAYSDRLKCANQTIAMATLNVDVQKIAQLFNGSAWIETACSPEAQYAAVFIDMKSAPVEKAGGNKSLENIEEASLVLALVEALIEGGVTSSDIGVIAPFRDQVSLLRRSLAHRSVEASTVDQFQGRDKSVILYSCTKRYDGTDDKKAKDGEVLNDQRRLAVSVTRAKHKLILVGNRKALRRYTPLQRLIESCYVINMEQDTIRGLISKYSLFVA